MNGDNTHLAERGHVARCDEREEAGCASHVEAPEEGYSEPRGDRPGQCAHLGLRLRHAHGRHRTRLHCDVLLRSGQADSNVIAVHY